ncbi:ankyrin repeat, SAM and basic leucine zipper domain-containing protein 1 [Amblyraja radiata]|uniref:ankyrin repeat, SAM and basic leucine zipper domain-containing protein 1 n=1 Tax=Amblyraja radiata TaxID=386614 RepID=UPI00140208FE|nr:ankyrin repeat, SAM and basic leucine zipper domain-containing protein 1 [Amblyraja radiata]
MAACKCVAAGAELDDSDDGWYLGCDGMEDMDITPVKAYEIKNIPQDKSSVFEISKNDEEASTLKEALSSQNSRLVEQILNSGVDVETRFCFGWTPLMYAANIANLEICRLLLDRGANASFVKDQYTVLMAACASRESDKKVVKCVELLLSRNANPSTTSSGQMTPLMFAAKEGHTQTVALLVAHGVEINIQDDKGYTALTWASVQGHKSTALQLIDLGADKSLKTNYGETAADVAEKKQHSQLAQLLKVTSISPLAEAPQNLPKDEISFKYSVNNSNTGKNNCISSISTFGEVELFLYGLELEHLRQLLKENDISFRGLLTMGKEELEKIGIIDPNDQQKILDAVCEMQPEDIQVAQLPTLNSFDRSEELTVFFIKLKKHCNHLMATIQNVTNQLASNSELKVLDLDADKKSALICEDLVACIQDLNKEVESLRNLLLKLQNNQERAPNHMPPIQNCSRRFLKKVALGLFGTGFVFLLMKLHNMRK